MITVLVVGLFVVYFYYHLHHKRKNLPPGPLPLPIVGNLLEVMLNEPGEAVYAKWNKKYGGLFTFFLGDEPTIMVTDAKKMNAMFVKDADTYSGRSVYRDRYGEYMKLARGGIGGITFGDGESWRTLRAFALQTFKHLGMGKNVMQELIFLDLDQALRKIDADIENGLPAHRLPYRIDLTISSIICNLCFAFRVTDENEHEFVDLLRETNIAMRLFAHPANLLLQRNPRFFKHLPYFGAHLTASKEAITFVNTFLKTKISEHEAQLINVPPEDIVVTDFLTGFIKARATCAEEKRQFFNHDDFVTLAGDLWFAGQDTSSETIKWAIAHLIHKPEFQLRAQQELDNFVGPDRLVTLNDKPKLPFCVAIANEAHRIGNILPLNLLHSTTRDVTIEGYRIKKGTAVVPQISAALVDDRVFTKPTEFDPTRFIDENDNLRKFDEFLPFSLGKRSCMGESLGRAMVFLFLSNFLNRYNISASKTLPCLQRRMGLTVHIDDFDCKLEKRT